MAGNHAACPGYQNLIKNLQLLKIRLHRSDNLFITTGMSYEEAIERAFYDIPVLYNADLGHMPPTMAMINGAIMNLDFEENEYKISFQMK